MEKSLWLKNSQPFWTSRRFSVYFEPLRTEPTLPTEVYNRQYILCLWPTKFVSRNPSNAPDRSCNRFLSGDLRSKAQIEPTSDADRQRVAVFCVFLIVAPHPAARALPLLITITVSYVKTITENTPCSRIPKKKSPNSPAGSNNKLCLICLNEIFFKNVFSAVRIFNRTISAHSSTVSVRPTETPLSYRNRIVKNVGFFPPPLHR